MNFHQPKVRSELQADFRDVLPSSSSTVVDLSDSKISADRVILAALTI